MDRSPRRLGMSLLSLLTTVGLSLAAVPGAALASAEVLPPMLDTAWAQWGPVGFGYGLCLWMLRESYLRRIEEAALHAAQLGALNQQRVDEAKEYAEALRLRVEREHEMMRELLQLQKGTSHGTR